MADTDIQCWGA